MEHGADLIPGDTLPVHRVRARNLSRDSENRIHDDEVARRYGFAGGLVTGTTVYAYLSHPLVRLWGQAWLEGGAARIRLTRPIYEGDLVSIEAPRLRPPRGPPAGRDLPRPPGPPGHGP